MLTTSDPNKKITGIPVSLHLNEAPHFATTDVVVIGEGEERTIDIAVTDKEGDTFTVQANETSEGVSSSFANGKLRVTLRPTYGTAGNKEYTFKATDHYQASSEFALHVEVGTPIARRNLSAKPNCHCSLMENLWNSRSKISSPIQTRMYSRTRLPLATNHSLTYSCRAMHSSLNRLVPEQWTSRLQPLTFMAPFATHTVTVVMDVILATEQGQQNQGLNVYPNPMEDKVAFEFSNEWRGDLFLEIVDATGRKQLMNTFDASRSGKIELNVSGLKRGVYILRATSTDKQATIKLIKK